jgi:single-strand DNA-binding protein
MTNRVTLIGHLGKNPEFRNVGSGGRVCNFSVATAERYKDRGGEWQSKTDWHNVVVWNEFAQRTCDMLEKGSKVHVEGKLRTRKYTDRDGNDRYMTEVVVENYGGSVDAITVPERRDDDRRGGYSSERGAGGFKQRDFGGGRHDDDRRSFGRSNGGSSRQDDDDRDRGYRREERETKPPSDKVDNGLQDALDDDIPF